MTTCRSCGAQVTEGQASCPACGAMLAGADGQVMTRTGAITALAVYDFVVGAFLLLGTLGMLGAMFSQGARVEPAPMLIGGLLYGVAALVHLAAGGGMLSLAGWGRILQIILAIVGLCAIPFGTVLSILVLVYLFRPGARVLFSGQSSQSLTPTDLSELTALRGSGLGTAIVVFVAIVPVLMVLIIAAIAIPNLLRARLSANESATIGDVHTIYSAEEIYRTNTGMYASLECLAQPSPCHSAAGTLPLIEAKLASSEPRSGYQRTLHLGPTVALPQGGEGPAVFAYVAVPVKVGNTGNRAFCGDSAGVVCFTADGSAPALADGICDTSSCTPLY